MFTQVRLLMQDCSIFETHVRLTMYLQLWLLECFYLALKREAQTKASS